MTQPVKADTIRDFEAAIEAIIHDPRELTRHEVIDSLPEDNELGASLRQLARKARHD